MHEVIETLIRVLERLKGESPEFQADALWKMGDFVAEAIELGWPLEEEVLFERLRGFHEQVSAMDRQG